MKKTVLDIDDLQTLSPIFRNGLARAIGKWLIRWLQIDRVNRIHATHSHLSGSDFTNAILADPMMDVKYRIHHADRLETLPEGAFVTISNHPIGSIDGIILIDIFGSRRPDFKVLVNGILARIGALRDSFIAVQPPVGKARNAPTHNNPANINGVRLALGRLREGHPMGIFPAGAMSMKNNRGEVRDLPWRDSVVRLIRKAGVPVYPVFFDCLNSPFFYRLGRISWRLRTLRVAIEAFNKRGLTIDVYIGQPIPPETVRQYTDDTQLANFLYTRTYAAKV